MHLGVVMHDHFSVARDDDTYFIAGTPCVFRNAFTLAANARFACATGGQANRHLNVAAGRAILHEQDAVVAWPTWFTAGTQVLVNDATVA